MTYLKVAYLKNSALPEFLEIIWKGECRAFYGVVGNAKQINGIWQFIFKSND